MMYETEIGLGDLVEDRITGIKGIVTSVAFWLNGCIRFCLVEHKPKDPKINEFWIDEPQLKLIKKKFIEYKFEFKNPGGPRNDYQSKKDR